MAHGLQVRDDVGTDFVGSCSSFCYFGGEQRDTEKEIQHLIPERGVSVWLAASPYRPE